MALLDDALITLAKNSTVHDTDHLFAADWFETLGCLIETLHDECHPLFDVTPAEIVDLAITVALAEATAETTASGVHAIYSSEARQAIDTLTAHGLPADKIALIFGFSFAAVQDYLKRRRRTSHEPEILALHRQGLSTTQISKQLMGVSQQLADKVIRRNGGTPNVVRGLSEEKRTAAVALFEGQTHTWDAACTELGITRWQYRNVLRAAGYCR